MPKKIDHDDVTDFVMGVFLLLLIVGGVVLIAILAITDFWAFLGIIVTLFVASFPWTFTWFWNKYIADED